MYRVGASYRLYYTFKLSRVHTIIVKRDRYDIARPCGGELTITIGGDGVYTMI